jgi:hypothetical protein
MLMVNQLIGFGVGGVGPATTVFDVAASLTEDDPVAGLSIRQLVSSISTGGSEIRITVKPGAGTGLTVAHCSVGHQLSAGQTTATPVELLFSGGAGFVTAAGVSVVSDWLSFSTTASETLIVVIDVTTGNVAGLAGLGSQYYKTGATYNDANPAGLSSQAYTLGLAKVEVR